MVGEKILSAFGFSMFYGTTEDGIAVSVDTSTLNLNNKGWEFDRPEKVIRISAIRFTDLHSATGDYPEGTVGVESVNTYFAYVSSHKHTCAKLVDSCGSGWDNAKETFRKVYREKGYAEASKLFRTMILVSAIEYGISDPNEFQYGPADWVAKTDKELRSAINMAGEAGEI